MQKRKFCPYFNPFTDGADNIEREDGNDRANLLKKTSLTIMENFVYTGISNDYKQLGCMIALSALTMVSIPARNSLPWLYGNHWNSKFLTINTCCKRSE